MQQSDATEPAPANPPPVETAPDKSDVEDIFPPGRRLAATRDIDLWLIRNGAPTAGRATIILAYVREHPSAAVAPGWQEYPKQVAGVVVHTREQEDVVRRAADEAPGATRSSQEERAPTAPGGSADPLATRGPAVAPVIPGVAPSTGPGAPPPVASTAPTPRPEPQTPVIDPGSAAGKPSNIVGP